MIKNILNVQGVKTLNKEEKQSIKAGAIYYGEQCGSICEGGCSGGYCYQWLY
ncbi:hypothetical protein [uncultured Aquimarina sp.]|uniref:hypothetical protein n=1 Tax=uncultured Aquimarina sp. TaxID=575652 RepID=UPI00261772A5|nr:hypothetical protein [uncultured Aquimarina sp.]